MTSIANTINNTNTTIKDFIPLEKLGQGSFSTVYKVNRISDGKIYALKKVKMNNLTNKEKENAINEIRILASIESNEIIAYKQAFYDQSNGLLCIVMQYADGGDLLKCISTNKLKKTLIPEKLIRKAVIEIIKGLAHLHSKGILHRDLKCANIFISSEKYKLGDLNVSKINKGNLAYTQTGTPYYASPQVWRDEPYDGKSDVWSLGCIIYQMMCLRPPFIGNSMQQLYKNIQKGVYDTPPKSYSKELHKIINLCLQKHQRMRPNSKELIQIVKKEFPEEFNQNTPAISLPVQNKELLGTIRVPLGLKGLQNNLPKSKYQQKKEKEQIKSAKKMEDIIEEPSEQTQNLIKLSEALKQRSRAITPCKTRQNSTEIVRERVKSLPRTQKKQSKQKNLIAPHEKYHPFSEDPTLNVQVILKNKEQLSKKHRNSIIQNAILYSQLRKKDLVDKLIKQKKSHLYQNPPQQHKRIQSAKINIMPCWWG